MSHHQHDYLLVEEVQNILRVSRAGVYDLIRRREIPSIRIGRLLRVPREPFERLLDVDTNRPK